MTGPRADWPALRAPTDRQVVQVLDVAMGRSLVDMRAELRHVHTGTWVLEVIGTVDDRKVWYFGDQIEAVTGQETAAAAARLALAGYQVLGWSRVDGGWDGELS